MLNRRREHWIRQAAVANDAISGKAHATGGRDNAATPIAEQVAIGRDFDDWVCGEEVRHNDIRRTGKVCAQYHDHRRRLWKIVEHFESDAQLHSKCLSGCSALELATKTTEYKALAALFDQMRP